MNQIKLCVLATVIGCNQGEVDTNKLSQLGVARSAISVWDKTCAAPIKGTTEKTDDLVSGDIEGEAYGIPVMEDVPVAISPDEATVVIGPDWSRVTVSSTGKAGEFSVTDPSGTTRVIQVKGNGVALNPTSLKPASDSNPNEGVRITPIPGPDSVEKNPYPGELNDECPLPELSSGTIRPNSLHLQQWSEYGAVHDVTYFMMFVLPSVICAVGKHVECACRGGPDWSSTRLWGSGDVWGKGNDWVKGNDFCPQPCRESGPTGLLGCDGVQEYMGGDDHYSLD